MLNPFDTLTNLGEVAPPMVDQGAHVVPPPALEEENQAQIEPNQAAKPDPHASKTTPHGAQGGTVSPSRGALEQAETAQGGVGFSPETEHGGVPDLPGLNHGGPVSEAQMAMGVWVDEPPFATELRQALADLMTQARIAAGAKKSYHSKLRRGQPEPTFDLVGGALDSEAMLRLDLACLSILSRKHAECLAQGLDREARWVNGVYYRRADAVTAPMLDEARQLLERLAKAEDRFAQPFDSPATQEKARAALGVIIDRYAELVTLIEEIAPGASETLIQEEAA